MVGIKSTGSRTADLQAELVAHFRRPARYADAADMVTTVRHGLAAAAQDLDTPTAVPPALARAAARWAREGVALESVLTACHECARNGLEFLAGRPGEPGGRAVADAAQLLGRVVEVVTTAAATAYLDEHRLVAREHQTAAQTMVAALLAGHGVSALARSSGLRVAPMYQVVALALSTTAEERSSGPGAVSAARRKLRRVQAALGPAFGSRALSLLHAGGGTVLIPLEAAHAGAAGPEAAGVMTDEVLAWIAEAAEAPATATVAEGASREIPELADRAHDLLDRLRATDRPPGLYRVDKGVDTESDPVVQVSGRLRWSPGAVPAARAHRGNPGAA